MKNFIESKYKMSYFLSDTQLCLFMHSWHSLEQWSWETGFKSNKPVGHVTSPVLHLQYLFQHKTPEHKLLLLWSSTRLPVIRILGAHDEQHLTVTCMLHFIHCVMQTPALTVSIPLYTLCQQACSWQSSLNVGQPFWVLQLAEPAVHVVGFIRAGLH